MAPEELDAIEARATAATAGPWVVWSDEGPVWLPNRKALPRECLGGWTMSVCHHEGSFGSSDHRCVATAVMRAEDDAQGGADAAFVAAARTDVPALVAEVRRLQAELDSARDTLAYVGASTDREARVCGVWVRASRLGQPSEAVLGQTDDGRTLSGTIAAPILCPSCGEAPAEPVSGSGGASVPFGSLACRACGAVLVPNAAKDGGR